MLYRKYAVIFSLRGNRRTTKNNTIHSDGVTIMGWVMGLEPTIFRATI